MSDEAFKLEVSILDALLSRNQCSHRKTKYYQRISMFLRAMSRHQILDLSPALKAVLQLVTERQTAAKKKERKRQKTQQFSLLMDKDMILCIRNVQQSLVDHFPEVLSRLEYASSALFLEVSRGFFLPFCTIALGALARIRVLLMRLGHRLLNDLQQLESLSIPDKKLNNMHQPADGLSCQQLFLSPDDFVKCRFICSESDSQAPLKKSERNRVLQLSIGISHDSAASDVRIKSVELDSEIVSTEETAAAVAPPVEVAVEQSMMDVGQALHQSNSGGDVMAHVPTVLPSTSSWSSRALQPTSKKQKQLDPTVMRSEFPSSKKVEKVKTPAKKTKKRKKDFFDELFD